MIKSTNFQRYRTYRIDQQTRDRYADVHLTVEQLIAPIFLVEGDKVKKPVSSFEGVYHLSIDQAIEEITLLKNLGIDKVILFGVIDEALKSPLATEALNEDSIIPKALRVLRNIFPDVDLITDICLCAYTDHGHCGIVQDGIVLNDETLPYLSQMALIHARSGATRIAPSAMMDGQVAAIRKVLDENGFELIPILGYSAKYASYFYGPFRDLVHSTPSFGDRKTYQMDYRTTRQGVAEVRTDIEEGASWVMVKPAHTYLDMIARVKLASNGKKIVGYHTSGECMMIKAAAKAGIVNENEAIREITTAIRRAGADYIITYFAKEIAQIIK